MDENKPSSISGATTLDEMGTFWDAHDFTEFDTDAADVNFTVAHTVRLEADLPTSVEQQAHLRGVSVETLANLWLQQKLAEESFPRAI